MTHLRVFPPAKSPPINVGAAAVPVLPAYAFDGRPLSWNEAGTAVSFDSTSSEYHSDRSAVSSTSLRAFLRSPAHMQAAHRCNKAETPSQRLGTAVHALALEPFRFSREYISYKGERRGKAWTSFQKAHPGKSILTASEWEQVHGCAAAIKAAPVLDCDDGAQLLFGELAACGQCERVIYWWDEQTGLTCKARIDLMLGPLTLDVKTTDDARGRPFAQQSNRLGYDVQAAHYLAARSALTMGEPLAFGFVVAELTDPYAVQIHIADTADFIVPGQELVRTALNGIAASRKARRWPGYARSGGLLKLPEYRLYARAMNAEVA